MPETWVREHRRDADRFAEDARSAIETARWAPSVHNTQPWRFGVGDRRISVRGDADRRLEVADPAGREMLISCGAAIFTLGLALRGRGYAPRVRLLPDPDRPQLLAELTLDGPATGTTGEVGRLLEQVGLRSTHRGPFLPVPLPAGLLSLLREEARREGAVLHVVTGDHAVGALAALTQAAEHLERSDPGYDAEMTRWAPEPGSRRSDGVQDGSYPRQDERTEPHFAARGFARGQGWGSVPEAKAASGDLAVGTVALLTTRADGPEDWLRAGQALQRVLLRAQAEGNVSAAFHTQPLEIPELREVVRSRLCGGEHPQMLLRLGVAESERATVRRPADEVTDEDF
ncbi:Acg family FMN-binding oxidoreductase [Thermomonospora cellulosilytica]|uniref:Nitroreductase n=1 Tax=Thermomonospora cellulosilytica TaxID=1411118 RepID=A0A7W3N0G0_9ACTN|nr:hypothetical protein [Thermomonospora cellulosilytica]MBA9005245.1 nitroreductase [Thermomonospora cellulosilytica]